MSARGSVAAIVAVYNGEEFLAAALESVRAQTRPVHEVIVVDDGSTDRSAEIARGFPGVVLIQQHNAGPAAARNRGIAVARSDYLAMLDADDLWPANRTEVMAGLLDADPSLGLVIGNQRLLVEPGAQVPDWVPAGDPEAIPPDQLPKPTGVFMARRETFDAVGLFEESLRHAEDTDFYLRSQDAGVRWGEVPDVVLVRRLHGRNLTNDAAAQRRAMFEVLQRRMRRRRSQ
ncbi:MAG: glycosyltransferase family 2 protein [Actinomycetales bacterium]|nr:glycosyltransferase family 2 protein [Actinomycetales bacterium]